MSWRSSPRTAGSAWRDAVNSLKLEAKASGTLPYQAVVQAIEALSRHLPDSKDQEVPEDLAFIAQQLLQQNRSVDRSNNLVNSGRAEVLFCRLLCQVLGPCSIRLNVHAGNILCSTLRQWADAHQNSSDDGDCQLQCEALQALNSIVQDNFSQVAAHERAALLALLLSLAHPPAIPSRPSERQGAAADECQRLVLQGLAGCCGHSGGLLSKEDVDSLLKCTVAALQGSCLAPGRVVEDAHHSRFYATLLRALHAAISEGKRGWVPHASTIVEGLRKMFTYGVSVAPQACTSQGRPASASNAGTPQAVRATYRPPHLRSTSQHSSASFNASDSDASDVDSSSSTTDRFKSSKVRMAVLQCLQLMCKSDSRALHPLWTVLLPMQQPLQQRPLSPHLVTMLLFDPTPKVRSTAAATISALLEGPAQRGFMAVAEAKSMVAAQRGGPRSFTTLSTSLGQMLLALHTGLLHGIATEGNNMVLCVVLRALCVLLSASPYERLPASLLPEVVEGLQSCWRSTHDAKALPAAELNAIQTAYLACLAEAFSTKQPSAGLAAYLQYQAQQTGQLTTLIDELFTTSIECHAVLRTEALAALKGLAKHYIFTLPGTWHLVLRAAERNLAETSSSCSSGRRSVRTSISGGSAAAAAAAAAAAGSCGGRSYSSRGPSCASPSPRATSHRAGNGGGSGGGGFGSSRDYSHGGGSQGPRGAGVQGLPAELASASTSPEDKAAQHAVQLLGEYLAGLGRQQGRAAGAADAAPTATISNPMSSQPTPTSALMAKKASCRASGCSGSSTPAAAAIANSRRSCSSSSSNGSGQQQGSTGKSSCTHELVLNTGKTGCSGQEDNAGLREGGANASGAGPASSSAAALAATSQASAAAVAAMWQEAMSGLIPAATSHNSYMVRSAALALFTQLPEAVYAALPTALQVQLVMLMVTAACEDAAPAVRSTACKVLGTQGMYHSILHDASLSEQLLAAITTSLHDPVLSVRIASSWALANLCDAHHPAQQRAASSNGGQDAAQVLVTHTVSEPSTRSSSGITSSTTSSMSLPSTSTSMPKPSTSTSNSSSMPEPSTSTSSSNSSMPDWKQLAQLCRMAVEAAQDVDKVRASGIRAVGALLSFMEAAPQLSAHLDLEPWLDTALTCLQSCMTTGSMKVQWDACHAVLCLFSNTRLLEMEKLSARTAPLLLLLVMLVRDCSHFKIRTYAATALAALPSRAAYGDVYADALLVVCSALEAAKTGASSGPVAAAASSRPAAASIATAGDSNHMLKAEDEGFEEGQLHNYRYAAGLTQQLRCTLLHLLALLEAKDSMRLRDALAKRAEFLTDVLQSTAVQLLKQHAGIIGSRPEIDTSAVLSTKLPTDPFNLDATPIRRDVELSELESMVGAVEAAAAAGSSAPTSSGLADVREHLETVLHAAKGFNMILTVAQGNQAHAAIVQDAQKLLIQLQLVKERLTHM